MQRKVIQLVEIDNIYALYEAIINTENNQVEWIAEEPIVVYESYKEAVFNWGKREKKYSALLDIMDKTCYNDTREKENQEEKELCFD